MTQPGSRREGRRRVARATAAVTGVRTVVRPGVPPEVRPGVWPVVRLVVAMLVAGLVGGLLGGCSDRADPRTSASTTVPATASATTPPDAPDPSTAREDALTDLLAARASAVRRHDRRAFAATLDDPASGFGLRQLAQYDALAKLPLGTFSYGTPEPAPELGAERLAQLGPDAWASRVAGRYALAGFDTSTREFESYFTVVRRGADWRLADDTDGGTQVQPWDLPGFTVVRSPTALVMGSGPASRLRPYLSLATLAVKRVDAVWTAPWNSRLVLVVPKTTAQMAEQVGQDKDSVAQVAAVTDGPFDTNGRAGADRVVVNPGAFATLERRGQQVVVTHEATHVAIRATTDRPVPLWLSEGMADYVGYRDVGATRRQVAAALLVKVRAGTGPKALPTAADFDPSRTTIAPSYNAAWLAVNRIVDRYGRAALVRYYLAVATKPSASQGTSTPGTSTPGTTQDADAAAAAAFRSVLGTTEARFTKEWLAYLRALARG
ncbi:hypothetical protein SAMN04489867_0730 [Pedococcus dokdonensis]|uniref:Peptidase MA superfamily protein n=1 Tax=Pedococcus dokdonensis TaxID=443156 RepID=A0A1H0MW05_9MICO|nr:hypothetical protein [Pedococcus dokdonensis]SDO84300.1 hypothetical protein SAMN04489867_0730 [Pedococcus dokdonensis]